MRRWFRMGLDVKKIKVGSTLKHTKTKEEFKVVAVAKTMCICQDKKLNEGVFQIW